MASRRLVALCAVALLVLGEWRRVCGARDRQDWGRPPRRGQRCLGDYARFRVQSVRQRTPGRPGRLWARRRQQRRPFRTAARPPPPRRRRCPSGAPRPARQADLHAHHHRGPVLGLQEQEGAVRMGDWCALVD